MELPGRLMGSVDHFRVEAVHMLGDREAVEAALAKAGERSETSAALAKYLDPLRRLVAAHVSGEYTGADDSDIAWALAAVMYVAADWDLYPDYLPRGLHDDQIVAERVAELIKPTLVRFGVWDRAEAKRRRARHV